MEYPFQSGIEIMETQSRRINIKILISGLTFSSSYSPVSPEGHLIQFLQLLSDTGRCHSVSFNHNSIPSSSITVNNDGRQVSTSTRFTSISVAASITAPMARKVSSGEIPHAAISTSDHGVKDPLCTREPKITTFVALNRSFNNAAALHAANL